MATTSNVRSWPKAIIKYQVVAVVLGHVVNQSYPSAILEAGKSASVTSGSAISPVAFHSIDDAKRAQLWPTSIGLSAAARASLFDASSALLHVIRLRPLQSKRKVPILGQAHQVPSYVLHECALRRRV